MAKTYAEAFGVTPDWLLLGDGSKAGAVGEDSGFAGYLVEARRRQGFAQVELARRVGVSQSVIVDWERGRTWPRRTNAFKLAVGLVVEVESLPLISGDKGEPLSRPIHRMLEIPLDLDPDLLESWKAMKLTDRTKLLAVRSSRGFLRCCRVVLAALVAIVKEPQLPCGRSRDRRLSLP